VGATIMITSTSSGDGFIGVLYHAENQAHYVRRAVFSCETIVAFDRIVARSPSPLATILINQEKPILAIRTSADFRIWPSRCGSRWLRASVQP
jgi:hypothetical protein